jgi:predicted ArsR family transcriptional regulator
VPAENPPTNPPSLAEEWRAQQEGESTRNRVYAVALQLSEPTRVKEVAERADVSKETAREYLKWFAELGVLTQVDESPDTFARNEQYFEWRRIQRLQTLSEEKLLDQLEGLTRQERAFRERFGTDSPDEVDALEHAGYDDIESVWMELREWRTVRRRIRELERARKGQRDGTQVLA